MTMIAVVDVETTGLNPYRHNRIVELAVVVINETCDVMREFTTLVNPERDIGPQHLHGLTTRDVLEAPRFCEVIGAMLEVMDGCVAVGGHNVRFDLSFLNVECERHGTRLPQLPTLCTMHLAGGGTLANACSDYGIDFNGRAHSALDDARMTAQLLSLLLRDSPSLANKVFGSPAILWPDVPKTKQTLLSRNDALRRQTVSPSYLQTLLKRVHNDFPHDTEDLVRLDYLELLDRVLADRHIDLSEGEALIEVAMKWTLTGDQIRLFHRDYLLRLVTVALSDGRLADSERKDLTLVGQLLGVDDRALNEIMLEATQKRRETESPSTASGSAIEQTVESLRGKYVCFTGECQCKVGGRVISRDMAENLATQRGLIVAQSVTKKLDLLVVADPLTLSGKAKKARQYGIPIMYELVFWRVLGMEVG